MPPACHWPTRSRPGERVRFGLGALYAMNRVPAALEPLYSGDPFLRLKID